MSNKPTLSSQTPVFYCSPPPPPGPTFPRRRKEISGWIITGINTSGPSEGVFSSSSDILLNISASWNTLLNSFSSGAFTAALLQSRGARWGRSYGHLYFNLPPPLPLSPSLYNALFTSSPPSSNSLCTVCLSVFSRIYFDLLLIFPVRLQSSGCFSLPETVWTRHTYTHTDTYHLMIL